MKIMKSTNVTFEDRISSNIVSSKDDSEQEMFDINYKTILQDDIIENSMDFETLHKTT